MNKYFIFKLTGEVDHYLVEERMIVSVVTESELVLLALLCDHLPGLSRELSLHFPNSLHPKPTDSRSSSHTLTKHTSGQSLAHTHRWWAASEKPMPPPQSISS